MRSQYISFCMAFLVFITITISNYCRAEDPYCFNLYQWSSNIAFSKNNIVRERGIVYKALENTIGKSPALNPASWKFMGMCHAQYYEKNNKCDFNGDGKMDIAKGLESADLVSGNSNGEIPYDQKGLMNAGEVAIFYDMSRINEPADQVWTQNNVGMHPYAAANAGFGAALVTGDFNNDRFCDLAIGSPGTNMVNILYGSPTGLRIEVLGPNGKPINPYDAQTFKQSILGIPGVPEAGDNFGAALGAGDINGDGYDDLVIGVDGEDLKVGQDSMKDAGYIHIIYGTKSGLQTYEPKTVAYSQNLGVRALNDIEAGDHFGNSIDVSDFDHDGYADLVLSARGEDNRGKISLIRGSPDGIDVTSRTDWNYLNFPSSEHWTGFGNYTKAYDVNGDGNTDLEIDLTNYNYETGDWPYWKLQIRGSASGLDFSHFILLQR